MEELDAEHKRRHVTGIGLTSINKLMKLRYGEEYGLHIESQKGYGTKVYVIFPGKESGICAEGMIVDDEMIVRIGIQSCINWEEHGCQVILPVNPEKRR